MSSQPYVLVAIMNNPRDFAIAREQHGYRHLGGLTTEGLIPRTFIPDDPEGPQQLILLEPEHDDDAG